MPGMLNRQNLCRDLGSIQMLMQFRMQKDNKQAFTHIYVLVSAEV